MISKCFLRVPHYSIGLQINVGSSCGPVFVILPYVNDLQPSFLDPLQTSELSSSLILVSIEVYWNVLLSIPLMHDSSERADEEGGRYDDVENTPLELSFGLPYPWSFTLCIFCRKTCLVPPISPLY